MAFDWNEYLIVATKLKEATFNKTNTGDIEALRRIAISRAYYSVYHLAVEYAESYHGYTAPRIESHKAIIDLYLARVGNIEHQRVGKILSRLRKDRCDSDYESKNLGDMQALLESVILGANEIKNILAR